ncbi:non-ribosomal peptide synthetase [Micromonospora sp. WMMA1923]|uniref:non-ribosomal peptide synthetase n=1 Tax=Micromonospora sp. WMMA1923 TaxID=3404125 RepID=UPI003B961961
MSTSAGSTPSAGAPVPSLADTRRALLAVRERQRQATRATGATITPARRDRPLPLSFAQQRLWFLDQWAPGLPVYNSPVAIRLRRAVDVGALGRALTALVDRHEVLRTRYAAERGVPYQIVDPAPEATELDVVEATGVAGAAEIVTAVAREPIDLGTGPVFRPSLIRIADDDHVLVLALHHIAFDGWSAEILLRDLITLYQRELTGVAGPLPALPVQYADYAVWQRGRLTGEVLEKQLGYWRDRLAGLPTLDLPTDRPRPVVPTGAGSTLETVIPTELHSRLVALARTERVTLLTVLLAGFTAVLSRYTGQRDLVIGSVFSGRTSPEIEPLIGFFANTLVLRTSTEGDPAFTELLARTNETVLGAHFHQDLPFGRLVDELRPERDPSRNPLFQVSFTMETASAGSARFADVGAELFPLELGTARFDLAVQVTETPGAGMRLWAEFSTELFEPDRISRLFGHYLTLLAGVVDEPGRRLSQLPLLTADERHALVVTANDTQTGPPDRERCLHQLFEDRVDADPQAPALRWQGATHTYGEVDAAANRLARALRTAGVGPETPVAILLPRSPELPTAMLAVLKAGGAYLPLDPDHPPARWATLLAEAGCRHVVTAAEFAADLPPETVPVLAADPAHRELPGGRIGPVARPGGRLDPVAGPGGRLDSVAGPGDLAYVIFTSGSTGRPKGVAVEHRSIVNFTTAIVELFRLGPGDRVLQFANPSFDVSLFDFFSALCSGATLVQAPRTTLLDPAALTALMRDEQVTVTDLPPAVLGLLDPTGLPALRTLFVGLEPFPGELVNRWNTKDREFHNGYGPTEATVACINYRCPDEHHESMPPIGVPLANYTAYVLDPAGNLVPVGVPGELYVGGVGVARGYVGRPGLTAERFVPDPFGAPGGRLYRTGDLVRRRADGNLEFLGRVDNQIKLRGLRIEPSEIEHVVGADPQVAEVAVLARGSGADARLVAYVVPVPGTTLDQARLRQFLAERLPAYLVPGQLVELPELPRGASGKLDRNRLLAESGGGPAPVPTVAPRTPTEVVLAEIWAELLTADGFGVHDSFFAVGGNSLQATQLVSRIRDRFGVTLSLRDVFVGATIAQLAELVEEQELAAASDDELADLLATLEAAPPETGERR